MTAVQFSQPPGPPRGRDGLDGTLVVELVLPFYGQVSSLRLFAVYRGLQTLHVEMWVAVCVWVGVQLTLMQAASAAFIVLMTAFIRF